MRQEELHNFKRPDRAEAATDKGFDFELARHSEQLACCSTLQLAVLDMMIGRRDNPSVAAAPLTIKM
jgi:hypothetical protein